MSLPFTLPEVDLGSNLPICLELLVVVKFTWPFLDCRACGCLYAFRPVLSWVIIDS